MSNILNGITEAKRSPEPNYDDPSWDEKVSNVGQKAKQAEVLKSKGKEPKTRWNPETKKYYVDFSDDDVKKESVGIPYPGTYEETNDMFKSSGQKRIGTLTTEQGVAEGVVDTIKKVGKALVKPVGDPILSQMKDISDAANARATAAQNKKDAEKGVAEGSVDHRELGKHHEEMTDQELRKVGSKLPDSWDAAVFRRKLASHPKYAQALKHYDKSEYHFGKAARQGVAEGLNEFAPDSFNGGGDGDAFSPEIAKMAQEDGFTKGAGLADGATLERAMAINHWHSTHGGMYKQYFAKGFKAGRMNKINHDNKQYNLNLKLMKDGSIRHGEQGVAEGLGGNWYIRVNGKILNDTKFKPVIFSSEDEARSHAMKLADKKRIPLSQMKLTKSWMDAPEQGVAEAKQRLDPKCWTGKHKEGTKMKGGVRVNNCVPNESAIMKGIKV